MDRHDEYRIRIEKNNNLKNVPMKDRFFVSGKGYAFGLDTNINALTSISELKNIQFPFNLDDLVDIYCGYNVIYYITKYEIYSSIARSDDVQNSGRDISNKIYSGLHNQKRIKDEKFIDKIHLSKNFTPSYYIKKISTGEGHTFILMSDNTLFCFGFNSNGQLGISSINKHIIYPTIVDPENYENEKIIDVVCGYYHSIILTESRNIYVSGRNNGNQIGGGSRISIYKFEKVNLSSILKYDETVTKINSSSHNSCFITNKGVVYGVGNTAFFTLGENNYDRFKPVNPFYDENRYVKNIWCSSVGSFIQLDDDIVYTAGQNKDLALFSDLPQEYDFTLYTKNTFLSGKKIADIKGFYTPIAIDENKENIYMSGNNACGQISSSVNTYIPNYKNNQISELAKRYSHLDIHIESGFRVCSIVLRKKDGYTRDLCFLYINLHAMVFGNKICFSDVSLNIL